MRFQGKAAYAGPFDDAGVPLLDYRGDIGRQHNPIAIAQYGLARFNRWCSTAGRCRSGRMARGGTVARRELKPNAHGVPVWFHHFDWPYRQLLKAPWYSGLAQGNGLSLLVRAAQATGDPAFADECASRISVVPAIGLGRRRAGRGRSRTCLDRGVPGRSAEPHPERLHLGALGRLRLRQMERLVQRREVSGKPVFARSRRASTTSTPGGGRSTSHQPAPAGCSPAATTTRFTSRSCASFIASAGLKHLPPSRPFRGLAAQPSLPSQGLRREGPVQVAALLSQGRPEGLRYGRSPPDLLTLLDLRAHPLFHALLPARSQRAGQPDARALPRVGGGRPRGPRRDLHSQPPVRQPVSGVPPPLVPARPDRRHPRAPRVDLHGAEPRRPPPDAELPVVCPDGGVSWRCGWAGSTWRSARPRSSSAPWRPGRTRDCGGRPGCSSCATCGRSRYPRSERCAHRWRCVCSNGSKCACIGTPPRSSASPRASSARSRPEASKRRSCTSCRTGSCRRSGTPRGAWTSAGSLASRTPTCWPATSGRSAWRTASRRCWPPRRDFRPRRRP